MSWQASKRVPINYKMGCIGVYALTKIIILFHNFRKAFDSMPHAKLIMKLEMFGLAGNLLLWLTNFLTNRKQRLKIGGKFSNLKKYLVVCLKGLYWGHFTFSSF